MAGLSLAHFFFGGTDVPLCIGFSGLFCFFDFFCICLYQEPVVADGAAAEDAAAAEERKSPSAPPQREESSDPPPTVITNVKPTLVRMAITLTYDIIL